MKKKLCCKGLAILFCLLTVFAAGAALAEEPALTFSVPSGFYDRPMTLLITCNVPEADIYYTTDGSLPDEEDLYYDEGIELGMSSELEDPLTALRGTTSGDDYIPVDDFPTGHAIRAVGILPDGASTPVIGGTFFIGYDREECYGDIPLMFLLMEPDDLFDYDTGIYVLGAIHEAWAAEQTASFEDWEAVGNFTQHGREWERPVLVEYRTATGEGFTQDMGVRIKGGASRGNKQKSLRLIAREDYGAKNIRFPIFPGNVCEQDGSILAKYKSFTLRNGGNDINFSKIRDPFITRVAKGLRLETAATQPVVAFINGEYWGMYTLTEEFSDNYIDYHYGINNDNVVTFKNGEVQDGAESDGVLFWNMHGFITGSDMADPACYEQACEMLDMGSFADMAALHFYIGNQDGIIQNNNWEMWRVREPGKDDHPLADGKWRVMLFDTDFSSGVYDEGKSFADNELTPALTNDPEGTLMPMLHALLKNEDFRRLFIHALNDMRNLYFEPTRMGNILADMKQEYLPYGGDTFRRFGPEWIARWSNADHHFAGKIDTISTYFQGRYNSFSGMVRNAFGLSSPVFVTLQSSDGAKGEIHLNGRDVPITAKNSTRQFKEYPITVTAVPAEGHRFLRWETEHQGVVIADPTALTTEISFEKGCVITAVFE